MADWDYCLFDGFIDGILIVDKTNSVLYLNSSCAGILHLVSPKVLLGENLLTQFPELTALAFEPPQDTLVYQHLILHSKREDCELAILAAARSMPQSDHKLVYLKDITIEVSLQNKFSVERRGRQVAMDSAETDSLTDCYNKKGFTNRLKAFVQGLQEKGGELSLIVLDLDGFKAINDAQGHKAGDLFLSKIALILKDSVRKRDVVARFGGDEFVIILSNCQGLRALRIAQRILKNIMSFKMIDQGTELSVTASLGLCQYHANITDPDEFFKMADSSCYAAKKAGKNTICIYPSTTPAKVK